MVSVDTIEEAIILRKEATEIFSEMKMKIRKWASNCEKVLKSIPEEDRFPIEIYSKRDMNQTEILNGEEFTFNETTISKDTKVFWNGMDTQKRLLTLSILY